MPPPPDPIVVHRWDATFELIETPIGLVLDVLRVSGDRAEIGSEPFSLQLDRPGRWEAEVQQAALQMLLEAKMPDSIRDVQVRLVPDGIRVAGKAKIIVEIPVEAMCRIVIRERKQLYVEIESVSVGGGAVRNLVQQQLDKINPVLDAADLPLKLFFDELSLDEGRLTLRGTVEP